MATIVFFHAHPDDESIATGGSILRAKSEGHRVVVVTATRGEEGEVDEYFLDGGRSVGDVRTAEMEAALAILGVDRHVYLGYRDSGMMGTAENGNPNSFWQANLETAAQKLAALLIEERADAVTVYDANGGYGHPDHIQVHRVGHRAADLAGTTAVFEATINREDAASAMGEMGIGGELDIGLPAESLNTRLDVGIWLKPKLKAMRAHASQISEDGWLLSLPTAALTKLMGTEWFARTRPNPHERWDWLLPPDE